MRPNTSARTQMDFAGDNPGALRVGGVVVNRTLAWRTDQLACGGIKASGVGRQRTRYAMRDISEERLVLFNL